MGRVGYRSIDLLKRKLAYVQNDYTKDFLEEKKLFF